MHQIIMRTNTKAAAVEARTNTEVSRESEDSAKVLMHGVRYSSEPVEKLSSIHYRADVALHFSDEQSPFRS